jgi:hypothetical protein
VRATVAAAAAAVHALVEVPTTSTHGMVAAVEADSLIDGEIIDAAAAGRLCRTYSKGTGGEPASKDVVRKTDKSLRKSRRNNSLLPLSSPTRNLEAK